MNEIISKTWKFRSKQSHHLHRRHYEIDSIEREGSKFLQSNTSTNTLSMISMMMIIIINPNCSKYFLFHILIIYSLFNLGSSLRLVMLEVPSPSYAGESIELSCIYDLEQDKLYSVKWYKNDVEFYRYVPKDWPPGQFLPINGIRVDLGKSGMNSVFLKFIDINTAGVYRCEVSAEAPSFVTAEGEKELHVTVLPLSGPRIIGVQPSYKIGDEVNLTCISARSKPYSTLKWYINNKEIKSVINASHVVHDDNLETSGLQLQFIALEKHFKSGAIHIKCTSTVIRIHTMSNEVLLRLESPMTSDKYLDSYFSETLNQPMDGVMSITGAQLHQSILIALISMVIGRHLSLVSSIVD